MRFLSQKIKILEGQKVGIYGFHLKHLRTAEPFGVLSFII